MAAGKRYNELITAAFFEAVDRHFGTRYTLTDIVEYVAEVRTRPPDPDRESILTSRND